MADSVRATIKVWRLFKNVPDDSTFFIPGDIWRYRKYNDRLYHPTYWELLEEDPTPPLQAAPDLLVQLAEPEVKNEELYGTRPSELLVVNKTRC